jgi:hypothetical protein
MNIYFKVVEVQIQALEYIPKLGRDTSSKNNPGLRQINARVVRVQTNGHRLSYVRRLTTS